MENDNLYNADEMPKSTKDVEQQEQNIVGQAEYVPNFAPMQDNANTCASNEYVPNFAPVQDNANTCASNEYVPNFAPMQDNANTCASNEYVPDFAPVQENNHTEYSEYTQNSQTYQQSYSQEQQSTNNTNNQQQYNQSQAPHSCPRCGYISISKNVKFCTKCGFDFSMYNSAQQQQQQQSEANSWQYNAGYYQQPKKHSSVIAITALISILACFVIFIGLGLTISYSKSNEFNGTNDKFFVPDNNESTKNPGGISNKELKQLKVGMTYAQISSIIGGDGALFETGATPFNEPYHIFAWQGEQNLSATVYITFINDKADEIIQEGVTK